MNKILKRVLIGIGAFLGLILLGVGVAYGVSSVKMGKKIDVSGTPVRTASDSATLAWGKHLTTAVFLCGDCHGAGMAGKTLIDEPAFAVLHAPNLTAGKGGIAADYTDADWERAIRHGIGKDGRMLLIMPSNDYYHASDEEVAAVISYVKTLPPVDQTMDAPAIGPIARILYSLGQLPAFPAEDMDHEAPRDMRPDPSDRLAYGRHLARITCQGCHSPELTGMPAHAPEMPPAANITSHEEGIRGWTKNDFVTALRSGKTPDGRTLNPEAMPWPSISYMTDEELDAVWTYVQSVEPGPSTIE